MEETPAVYSHNPYQEDGFPCWYWMSIVGIVYLSMKGFGCYTGMMKSSWFICWKGRYMPESMEK